MTDARDEEELARLESLPEDRHTALTCHALGDLYRRTGRHDDAIEAYQAAVNIDPSHYQSFAAAGDIFMENGMAAQAMDCYGCALLVHTDDDLIKEKFISLAHSARFTSFNPQMKQLLLECLRTPGLDVSMLGYTLYSLMQCDPALKKVLSALEISKYEDAREAFSSSVPETLHDTVFIYALKRQVVIAKPSYETALRNLRHLLLDQLTGKQNYLKADTFMDVAAALAHYCFHTDYIFDTTDEERISIQTLRKQAADGDQQSLALLGCYEPLYRLEYSQSLSADPALSGLIKLQVTNYFTQADIRKTITAITPIEDDVSSAVRQQYEESPYPCWTDCIRRLYNEKIEGRLRDRSARILVAGCGTGREAIELARALPDAEVAGIDLSTASLGYGIMKAREYGVTNISFRQADILNLGKTEPGKFDYIVSTGVLHHMQDPLAAWDILRWLMTPGGLMRLCLYSEPSRDAINKAHKIIADRGYSTTPDDIRRFRADAPETLGKKDYERIASYFDYYVLPECRDLLFHVHEKSFTLEQIKDYIDANELRFLGFNVAGHILEEYRQKFRDDPEGINLNNWIKFEKKNPESFTGMYRMWFENKGG